MKVLLFFLTLTFYCSVSGQELNPMLQNSKGFKEIQLTYQNLNLADFKKIDKTRLDLNHRSVEFPYTWKEYYPLHNLLEKKLYYSPNRNLFVDIYSGSCYVEEDQTISCDSGATRILLGNKTLKKISSIYLKSSSEQIIDVIWDGNDKVYLLKKWFFDEPEFEILRINLKDKTATTYKL